MKITTSTKNIKSFGGLNFVSAEFDHLKLPEMIAQHLGERAPQARFSYSDMIRNMWSILFCDGDCAEDLQTNLKSEFLQIQHLQLCSPDTVLRLKQSLALDK